MKAESFVFSFVLFSCVFLQVVTGHAELRIDSVTPNLGTMGQDLDSTIVGSGFDSNTRASMFLDTGNQSRIIGSKETGWANSVVVIDHIAFVADGQNGLQIVDVSYPASSKIIGSMETPGDAKDIEVVGNIAYIADGASGVQVFDVSDLFSPLHIGHLNVSTYAKKIDISGGKAYVLDDEAIHIIDVSDPRNLTIIESIGVSGSSDIDVHEEIAYIAAGDLYIMDVSNPQSPVGIGTFEGNGYSGLRYENKKLFATIEGFMGLTGTLDIIDVEDPSTPFLLSTIGMSGAAYDAFYFDNIVYVANGMNGLRIMDVSDISKPIQKGIIDTPGFCAMIDVIEAQKIAYLADHDGGIQIVDLNDIQHMQGVVTMDTPDAARGVFVENGQAYVADGSSLKIVDLTDPKNPLTVGEIDLLSGGYIWGFAKKGNQAFVTHGFNNEFTIFDISNPAAPVLRSSIELPDHAYGISVVDNLIFVACDSAGLYIVDVTEPWNPIGSGSLFTGEPCKDVCISGDRAYLAEHTRVHVLDIGSSWFFGPSILHTIENIGTEIWGVSVSDNFLYVADRNEGLKIYDITNPDLPTIVGTIPMPGDLSDVFLSDGYAYLAVSYDGLSVVPLPIEIKPISVLDSHRISLSIPAPSMAGHYTIQLFNGIEKSALHSAVTFVEGVSSMLTAKAVVVAGRGPSDTLWPETQMVADHAYEMLKVQGYTDERIMYLSSDTGSPEVDSFATSAALSSAIRQWALDASGLLVYFVGYGDQETFYINSFEALAASTLRTWLDELQATMPGPVVFIYDACLSGTFLPRLAAPDQRRILISSGSDSYSWLVNYGYTSFSFQFWSAVSTDANLNDAFSVADFAMSPYQNALLDANGNGKPGETEDRTIAASTWIGRGRIVEPDPSPIEAVTPPTTLYGSTSLTLWADIPSPELPVDSVWVIAIAPDDGDQTALMEIPLSDSNGDGRYEGVLNGISVRGTYMVTIYAKNTRDQVFDAQTTISQTVGVAAAAPDGFEDDDQSSMASTILVDDDTHQDHTFHDAGDADWVRFYAVSGQTYAVRAFNLGPLCDAVIRLYGMDGVTLITNQNSRPGGGEETLYWTCPADGVYFCQMTNGDPAIHGETVSYDLEIFQPHLSDSGKIHGTVIDDSGNPVPGARVKTSGGGGNLSRTDGTYLILHRPGSFTISGAVETQTSPAYAVTVEKAGLHARDIVVYPGTIPGDVNNDTLIDLIDGVLALQVTAGIIDPLQILHLAADINQDGTIGLAEAIYALRFTAGF